jgi:hypothetical protein
MAIWNKRIEITRATELRKYFEDVLQILKHSRVQKVFVPSAIFNYHILTDEEIYIQFENGRCLVLRTGNFSFGTFELQTTTNIWYHEEPCRESPYFKSIYGKKIKRIRIETTTKSFEDDYGKKYPAGEDYFSSIIMEFSGNIKIQLSPNGFDYMAISNPNIKN